MVLPILSSSNLPLIQTCSFQHPRPQHFSISYAIIKYIYTKPSSGKAWKKLIQTCKYFFSKNQIFPISNYSVRHWKADGKNLCAKKVYKKLWFCDRIHAAYGTNPSYLSMLIPKIYKCELQSLFISVQKLTFNEFQLLTSSNSLKFLHLYQCSIKYSNNNASVTLDKLIQNFIQLRKFRMICSTNSPRFNSDTVQKIVEILPLLKNLIVFSLCGLKENFDFSTFSDFLMKNKNVNITLIFGISLSDGYKEVIQTFVNKFVQNPTGKIPDIDFPNIFSDDRFKKYRDLYWSKKFIK